MTRPSTWFATALAFAVAAIGIWLLGTLFFSSVDVEWINVVAVLVGVFAAFRMFRRIT